MIATGIVRKIEDLGRFCRAIHSVAERYKKQRRVNPPLFLIFR